ncbi:MAG: DHA2 family efflux MFS transporter permease subunit [Betaproteobacteria bacterium]|nr:DHA2 family efflux MFS transporter permease subunit [Betaproteobacteria bacterium]
MSSAQASTVDARSGPDTDPTHVSAARRWWILVLVQISTLSFGMAITSTNVVVPQIRGALALTHDEGAWIVTLFLAAAAVATPLTGWLAGKFGWRRFMVTTLTGFTLSSLACGMANSFGSLLLARVAQGFFGAPLMPMGQGMLLATFPRRMHPLVLMLWGTGAVMGPTLGPIVGGVMADSFDWRWAFLVMVPIGVLTTLLAAFALGDQERGNARRLGATGFIALAVCLSSAQLMMDRGHHLDWFDSTEIRIELVLAICGGLVFVANTAWSRKPFLDPDMFRDRNFCVGLVTIFLMGAMSYTLVALYPPLLQDLRHYPEATIGYLMSARGAGNFLSFGIVVACTRYNARLTLAVGLVLQALAVWQMTLFNINVTDYDIYWTNLVQGFGFGLAYTPMTVLAFSTLPGPLVVQGSAVFNLLRNFGSSLFISFSILVLVRSTAENYAGLTAAVSSPRVALNFTRLARGLASDSVKSLSVLRDEIERQAAIGGYLNAFAVSALVAAIAVPLAFMFTEPKRAD